MTVLAAHIIRVTHTGVYEDGRPNTASIFIDDLNEGREFQTRKVQVYVPPSQTVDIPFSTRSLLSLAQGDIRGFIERGLLTATMVMRFRKIGDLGGSAGTGVSLRVSGADPNIERVGGELKLVLNNDEDAVGFLEGERFTLTGLPAGFENLEGEVTILDIAPEEDLAGANPDAFTITVASLGPDIAGTQLGTSDLRLLDGKITVLFESAGEVGGVNDSDLYGYIGGQFYPIDTSTFTGSISVSDEGIVVEASTTSLNFIGPGVTATLSGPGAVDVTIPGASVATTYTAGAAITVNDLVTLDSSGDVVPADSSIAGGSWDVIGVALATVPSGGTVAVQTTDGAPVPMRFIGAPAAAANGSRVFLSATSGVATLTPPVIGSGRIAFSVGLLQGADGASTTPNVVFRARYVSRLPA